MCYDQSKLKIYLSKCLNTNIFPCVDYLGWVGGTLCIHFLNTHFGTWNIWIWTGQWKCFMPKWKQTAFCIVQSFMKCWILPSINDGYVFCTENGLHCLTYSLHFLLPSVLHCSSIVRSSCDDLRAIINNAHAMTPYCTKSSSVSSKVPYHVQVSPCEASSPV